MLTPVAVRAAGAMLFFSTGTNNAWPLAWVASAPILAIVADLRAGRAARVSGENATVLVTADIPLGTGRTFYSRAGDWFSWLAMVIAAICLWSARAGARAWRP